MFVVCVCWVRSDDYGSLMHYGEYAFTNTQGQRTITVNVTAHNEYKAIYGNINIGQRSGLSPLDASAINSLYDTCFTSSSSSTYYWRSNPYLPCDCALGASVRKSFCHSTTGACVAESECLSRGVSKPQTTRPCVADINCNFDSSTCGWDLTPNLNDDTDWRRWNGATPSQTTGGQAKKRKTDRYMSSFLVCRPKCRPHDGHRVRLLRVLGGHRTPRGTDRQDDLPTNDVRR